MYLVVVALNYVTGGEYLDYAGASNFGPVFDSLTFMPVPFVNAATSLLGFWFTTVGCIKSVVQFLLYCIKDAPSFN